MNHYKDNKFIIEYIGDGYLVKYYPIKDILSKEVRYFDTLTETMEFVNKIIMDYFYNQGISRNEFNKGEKQ